MQRQSNTIAFLFDLRAFFNVDLSFGAIQGGKGERAV